ncbi:MAG: ATP-binding protein [Bacteroidales bacterium]|nr:ATP-binding protein [Bacteroidales bacterium]
MDLISRKYYTDKVDSWLRKGQIIVLVGQRRIGKSYVLKDLMLQHKNNPDTNIIYIDKEKKAFDFIKNHIDLNKYIDSHFVKGKHNIIIVDEIQDIEEWERSVRNYRTEKKTDIIITGSNARMLSSDLSTLLSGRYQEIHIHGLSYSEFLTFHDLHDSDEALYQYLNVGSLPGLRIIGIKDKEHIYDYLQGVLNTVVLKDVIERHNIRNVPFLNKLLQFLADNIGKPVSATNISNFMKRQGTAVSTNVVVDYSSYFEEAYLMKCVPRYDIHGKKTLETNGKYYFEDVGIRNLLAGRNNRDNDIEKVLENVVYLQLVRLGYDVKIGQLQAGDVDFVCERQDSKAYVQVCYLVATEETAKREFGTLERIADNHPKYVVSMSPLVTRSNHDGIVHIGMREFLKNGLD